MKRLVLALAIWSSLVLLFLVVLVHALQGCVTSPLLIEYGNNDLVCGNGDVMSPSSTYYQGLFAWWAVGVAIILIVHVVLRKIGGIHRA